MLVPAGAFTVSALVLRLKVGLACVIGMLSPRTVKLAVRGALKLFVKLTVTKPLLVEPTVSQG